MAPVALWVRGLYRFQTFSASSALRDMKPKAVLKSVKVNVRLMESLSPPYTAQHTTQPPHQPAAAGAEAMVWRRGDRPSSRLRGCGVRCLAVRLVGEWVREWRRSEWEEERER